MTGLLRIPPESGTTPVQKAGFTYGATDGMEHHLDARPCIRRNTPWPWQSVIC